MRRSFLCNFVILSFLAGLTFFGTFPAHAVIYVSDIHDVGIKTWDNDSAGNMPPLTDISGHLKRPGGIAVDANWIYVVNSGNDSIAVFPISGTGAVEPARVIRGVDTSLDNTRAVAVDANWIYVANRYSVAIFPKDADGNVAPTRLIQAISTSFQNLSGIAVDGNWIYASDSSPSRSSISVFPIDATGNIAPIRLIHGPNTTFDSSNAPNDVAVDANWIYVANSVNNSISVFPLDATGDVAPTHLIQGGSTGLNGPTAITVDASNIYVANYYVASIGVFPIDATGNVPPTRSIAGSNTDIANPQGVSVDANWIYASSFRNNSIGIFPLNATGNVTPTRSIESNTNLADPRGVAVDADWIYIADSGNSCIAMFLIDGTGDIMPPRLIQGANTQLGQPYGVAVDANWIYVADYGRDSVSVFDKVLSGDVVPMRSIKGPQTHLDSPYAIAVDDGSIFVASYSNRSIAVFPIGATGDIAPTRWIQGENTTLNGPEGVAVDADWIYVADHGNGVVVFPIDGTGDIPPSRKIQGGSTTLSDPAGVSVDASWIYVADYYKKISVFPIDAAGNVAPARTIQGSSTLLCIPQGITVDSRVVCSHSILPTSRFHGSGAETGTVDVTSPDGCNWTAMSNAAWITIASGATGSGNGTVNYSIAANPSTSIRTGTLTIAGQTFAVKQDGAPCTYSILPTSRSHGSGAETGSVDVTAPDGCNWTATSNNAWITITLGASGSGNGTVNYSITANPDTSPRSGTLTIAGQTFTVNQDGAACTYSILPTSWAHGSVAETGTVNVIAPTGCEWTATSNNGWITITSGASGSGNGTVGYSVSANASPSSRTGSLTIAGQTYTVTQDGSGYAIVLTSPSDGTSFDACSFYSLPTFAWSPTGSFRRYEIQFSSSDAFSRVSAKVKTSATGVGISSSIWKKILLIPGLTGGSVYWRIVGTRADRSQETSNVCSILVGGAQEVENPKISPTEKSSLPTLSWENKCNKKFKVWFGSDSSFTKKKSLSFHVTDPTEASLGRQLILGQWVAVRRLVGDVSGSTIYWYVESWDGMNRHTQTDVMSFALAD